MDKKLLKQKLHEQIDALENEEALQMLHEAAVDYGKSKDDNIQDILTAEQLRHLERSKKQHREGKTFTHEEVQQKVQEWLSK
jgi:hypothetical protein